MGKAGIVMAAAAVLGCLVWWVVREDAPAREVEEGKAGATTPSDDPPGKGDHSTRESVIPSLPFDASSEGGTTAEGGSSPAPPTLFGRCVAAEDGAPLAGCTVSLHGSGGDQALMDTYESEHGTVQWTNPKDQLTGADGRFSFRFDPPPPFRFLLRIKAEGRAEMVGRWASIEKDKAVDVGDVVMAPGVRIRATVSDDDARPQEVTIRLARKRDQARGPMSGKLEPLRWASILTRADGLGEARDVLAPGTYAVTVQDREIIGPATADVPEGARDHEITITVKPLGARLSIAGRVVDEGGTPLKGMTVRTQSFSRGSSTNSTATTDVEGRFEVVAPLGEEGEGTLLIVYGHPHAGVRTPVLPWGTREYRVVVARGRSVALHVIDGISGAPVEAFGHRVLLSEPTVITSSDDGRLRGRGDHPGGRATVTLAPGRHAVVVHPQGAVYAPSRPFHVEVTDAAPAQTVRVYPKVTATIRVRTRAGEPLVGSVVEVLRPWEPDGPIAVDTRATTQWEMWRHRPYLFASGETGADGAIPLTVPGHERVAVRAIGANHVPVIDWVTFVDDPAEHVLTVPLGATIAGEIGPPEFLERMKPAEQDRFLIRGALLRVNLVVQAAGKVQRSFPASGPAPLDDAGGFRIEGVPPGTYDLLLHTFEVLRDGGGSSTSGKKQTLARGITVSGEEEKRLDLQFPGLVRGRLRGRFIADPPLKTASLSFFGEGQDSDGSTTRRVSRQNIAIDAEKRFDVWLDPGTYRVWLQGIRDDDTWFATTLADVVTIESAADREQTLVLPQSVLEVRVVAAQSRTPLEGVGIQLEAEGLDFHMSLAATDADGRTRRGDLPAIPLRASIVPLRYSGRDGFQRLQAERKSREDVRIELGTVVPGGQPVTLEIPPDAMSGPPDEGR